MSEEKSSKKILLVEDDAFLRNVCEVKLKKAGLDVVSVVDGKDALEELGKGEKVPDLVLLDLLLPTMDGFEVLTRIRSDSRPEVAKVPVVILSNLSSEEEVEKAKKLGANHYLVKAQHTMDEIVEKVKELAS